MLFNSYEFIMIFLPLTWALYHFASNSRLKLWVLALSSYVFYGYWNYKFLPLLLFSTVVDFYVGRKIGLIKEKKFRKRWLLVSIFVNLGVLGFFKYFNFFAKSIAAVSGDSFIPWNIVLPVGISFYTFQSMSYTIDIYRGRQKPYENFLAFATYVSFFPQLVAGPIVRHDELVPQLINSKLEDSSVGDRVQGLQRFILGLAKKVIIADSIGNAVDQALIHLVDLSTLEAWMCALGYTFQLYFDFSGYSDMAIGLGRVFGFKFPENFNSPYKSKSITEFWRRWHMTLSFWLRDYLYISLGGNRQSSFRTYINLILTMLLGGLWHGASWVFVIWGGYHGLMLAVERKLKRRLALPSKMKMMITFIFVVFGWVLFRSPDIEFATTWFSKLFSFEGGLYYKHFIARLRDRYAFMMLVALGLCFFFPNTGSLSYKKFLSKKYLAIFVLLFVYIIMELGQKSPFLYFQF